MIYLFSALLFLFGYTLNMFYISVLYHRGLTHQAVTLGPFLQGLLKKTGVWMTGLDPKTWACMHRIHHTYADTERDPHSPRNWGVWGVWIGQYKSYLNIQKQLILKNLDYTKLVQDIPFEVSGVLKTNRSWLPYILHGLVAIGLYGITGTFLIGLGYFLGLMSHPFQGWLVNALAHRYGHRNFSTQDESTNNSWVGLLVFGEGYQNNHHQFPHRAKFSVKWYEFDAGYVMCVLTEKIGLLKINQGKI